MNSTFSFSDTIIEKILDNTGEGIALFTPKYDNSQEIIDFEYAFINQRAEELMGHKRQELLGTLFLATPGNVDYSDYLKAYKKVMTGGGPYQTEHYYSEEGVQKCYKVSAHKIESHLLVQFDDISGFMAVVSEESRSESLYRSLLKSLPYTDAILIDTKMNVVLSEGKPFKVFGYEKPLEEEKSLKDFLPPEYQKKILPLIRLGLGGGSSKAEYDQDDVLYRVHTIPMKDDKGQIFSTLILTEDIGIFNISSGELRNKIYELENANQSLEQFAYVASHDLQEPLRKIRAFGDRLKTKYSAQLDETAQDYINRMQNAASRMQKLIDDLLKYSRVGRFQEAFQEIELSKVIRSVLGDLESRIEDSQAEIDIQELPSLEGDAGMLEQLFTNLISNAIKFTKKDASPKVSIWYETEEGDEPEETKYQIYVKDNGIGFDEKYLGKIFNIFQRLHGRNEYEGTGIGLAICRKIVDAHSGTIDAKSTLGEGATFIVSLPKAQPTI